MTQPKYHVSIKRLLAGVNNLPKIVVNFIVCLEHLCSTFTDHSHSASETLHQAEAWETSVAEPSGVPSVASANGVVVLVTDAQDVCALFVELAPFIIGFQ